MDRKSHAIGARTIPLLGVLVVAFWPARELSFGPFLRHAPVGGSHRHRVPRGHPRRFRSGGFFVGEIVGGIIGVVGSGGAAPRRRRRLRRIDPDGCGTGDPAPTGPHAPVGNPPDTCHGNRGPYGCNGGPALCRRGSHETWRDVVRSHRVDGGCRALHSDAQSGFRHGGQTLTVPWASAATIVPYLALAVGTTAVMVGLLAAARRLERRHPGEEGG